MAITQVGSSIQFHPGGTHANSGQMPTLTVPADITVPVDTELVIIGVSTYSGTANGLANLTFTKNGVNEPMVRGIGGDVTTTYWQAAMFWLVLPDIGPNQTVTWDWLGASSTPSGSHMYSATFWKGVNCDDPVRSSAGMQGRGAPYTTSTLTAQTGDKLVAWFGGFCNGVEGTVTAWSGATAISDPTRLGDADGAWAAADPTGNQTVGATTVTGMTEGGLCACVLKPAGGTQYRLVSPTIQSDVGTALGIPVRNEIASPTGVSMTASPSPSEGVDTASIAGRIGLFGWGVR